MTRIIPDKNIRSRVKRVQIYNCNLFLKGHMSYCATFCQVKLRIDQLFLCCLKDIKGSVYICGADKTTIKSGIKVAVKSRLDPLLLTGDICS